MKACFARVEGQTLRLSGHDVLDLLQRISTQRFVQNELHGATTTIFLNEKGRIVEVMSVSKIKGEHSYLGAGWGRGIPALSEWISKYVIMEDARIADDGGTSSHIIVYEQNGADRTVKHIDLDPTDAYAFVERLGRNSWTRYVVDASSESRLLGELRRTGVTEVDRPMFERTRIEAGIPWPGRELTQEFNPLEVGLREYVDFHKGCYVGQEVVARLDSYQKVNKALTRVRGTGSPPSPGVIEDASGSLGVLSSVTEVERGWIGIALLKERAFATFGERFRTTAGTEWEILDASAFSGLYGISDA